jgi:hypothetical protein
MNAQKLFSAALGFAAGWLLNGGGAPEKVVQPNTDSPLPPVDRMAPTHSREVIELKNLGLITPRVAALLVSQFNPEDQLFSEKQVSKLPKSVTQPITPDKILELTGAIKQLAGKDNNLQSLPDEAIRAVVSVALFTEEGIDDAIKYIGDITELRKSGGKESLGQIKSHLLTDKSYSVAWLSQNLDLFDAKEKQFLDIDEKLSRAKIVISAFVNRVEQLKEASTEAQQKTAAHSIPRFNTPAQRDELFDSIPVSTVGALEKLMALISKGEGGYESVNWFEGSILRYSHDSLKAKGVNISEEKIGAVLADQKEENISAVGRFQLLEPTLHELVFKFKIPTVDDYGNWKNISQSDTFSPTNQDLLLLGIIFEKCPAIPYYLQGKETIEDAHDQLTLEFASLPTADGVSAYEGDGYNAAHPSITPADVRRGLEKLKSEVTEFFENHSKPSMRVSQPLTAATPSPTHSPHSST